MLTSPFLSAPGWRAGQKNNTAAITICCDCGCGATPRHLCYTASGARRNKLPRATFLPCIYLTGAGCFLIQDLTLLFSSGFYMRQHMSFLCIMSHNMELLLLPVIINNKRIKQLKKKFLLHVIVSYVTGDKCVIKLLQN